MTIVAPSMASKAPRMLGGATSLIYIGATAERRPTPRPPMNRPTTSWAKENDVVWIIAPMTNHTDPRATPIC